MNKDENKSPFFKKWWFWAVAVLIVGGVAIGVSSTNNNSNQTGNNSSSSSEQTEFNVGDVIPVKNAEITVNSFERNYSPANEYIKAKDGKEYVKVNLTVQNKSDETIPYNTLEWKIEDSNGSIEDYMSAAMASADDNLGSGELAAGGKKSGSIVFEVPAGDAKLKLHYKALWTTDKEIIVNL